MLSALFARLSSSGFIGVKDHPGLMPVCDKYGYKMFSNENFVIQLRGEETHTSILCFEAKNFIVQSKQELTIQRVTVVNQKYAPDPLGYTYPDVIGHVSPPEYKYYNLFMIIGESDKSTSTVKPIEADIYIVTQNDYTTRTYTREGAVINVTYHNNHFYTNKESGSFTVAAKVVTRTNGNIVTVESNTADITVLNKNYTLTYKNNNGNFSGSTNKTGIEYVETFVTYEMQEFDDFKFNTTYKTDLSWKLKKSPDFISPKFTITLPKKNDWLKKEDIVSDRTVLNILIIVSVIIVIVLLSTGIAVFYCIHCRRKQADYERVKFLQS